MYKGGRAVFTPSDWKFCLAALLILLLLANPLSPQESNLSLNYSGGQGNDSANLSQSALERWQQQGNASNESPAAVQASDMPNSTLITQEGIGLFAEIGENYTTNSSVQNASNQSLNLGLSANNSNSSNSSSVVSPPSGDWTIEIGAGGNATSPNSSIYWNQSANDGILNGSAITQEGLGLIAEINWTGRLSNDSNASASKGEMEIKNDASTNETSITGGAMAEPAELSAPQNLVPTEPIRVGKPVKWRLLIDSNRASKSFHLPSEARLLGVSAGGKDDSDALSKLSLRMDLAKNKSREAKAGGRWQKQAEHSPEVLIDAYDINSSAAIEYETPAPIASESRQSAHSKRIVVSSDVHYENIEASATLPKPVKSVASIHLAWRIFASQNLSRLNLSQLELDALMASGEIQKEIPFIANDTDNDSLYDTIYWIVPSLSNQTYDINLTIIDVYSHPPIYGNWSIGFNTTGSANLTITSSTDPNYTDISTRWTNYSEDGDAYDLKFLEIRCGSSARPYQWQGSSCSSGECSVFIENYTCDDETSYAVSKELRARKHVLKFEYGNLSAYAYNDVTISACAVLNTANQNYTLTANLTLLGNTCFNITAQNVTLDCIGNSITGNATQNIAAINSTGINTTIRNCVVINHTIGINLSSASTNSKVYNSTIINVTAPSVNPAPHVYGIWADGDSTFIFNNTILNLTSGSGPDNTGTIASRGYAGGNATGIYFNTITTGTIANNTISLLTPGKAGNSGENQTGGIAGNAFGIYLFTVTFSNITNNTMENLTGGLGGNGNTSGSGGDAIGFYLTQTSRFNEFAYNNASSFIGGVPGNGTQANGTAGFAAGFFMASNSFNNTLSPLTPGATYSTLNMSALNYFESAPALHFAYRTYLNIENITSNLSTANSSIILLGETTYVSTSLSIISTNHSFFSNLTLGGAEGYDGLSGATAVAGTAGYISAGIYAANSSDNNTLFGNIVSNTTGAMGGAGGVRANGGAGGAAYGVWARSLTNSRIANNTIDLVRGGAGGSGGSATTLSAGTGGAGGIAYGAYLESYTNGVFQNNTFINTTGGRGGIPGPRGIGGVGGAGAAAYGIYFAAGGNASNPMGGNLVSWVYGGIGANGSYANASGVGGAAYGLYATSASATGAFGQNALHNIVGGASGNITSNTSGTVGGLAAGIALVTTTGVNITENIVSNITGGDGGLGGNNTAGGSGGTGGAAYGIWTNPSTLTVISNNTISSIISGTGGQGGNGTSTTGGTGGAGGTTYGVYLQTFTTGVFQNNSISSIIGGNGGLAAETAVTTSAGGAGSTAYGVYAASSTYSMGAMSQNIISNVVGGNGSNSYTQGTGGAGGVGGAAYGFYATGAGNSNNSFVSGSISNVTGGNAGNATRVTAGVAGGLAAGIQVLTVTNFSIFANSITNITGGLGGRGGNTSTGAGGAGGAGGAAYGAWTNPATSSIVANNSIFNIVSGTGGQGGNASGTTGGTPGAGGTTYGIYLQVFTTGVCQNNTISNLSGGMGGEAAIEANTTGAGGAGSNANGIYFASGAMLPAPISGNSITRVFGGNGTAGTASGTGGAGGAAGIAYAFYATSAATNNASFDGNLIDTIVGGNAGDVVNATTGVAGGVGAGAYLATTITNFTVRYNNLTNIMGGNGGKGGKAAAGAGGGTGGAAYSINAVAAIVNSTIANNTVINITSGTGGQGGDGLTTTGGAGGAGGTTYGIGLTVFIGGIFQNNTIQNVYGGNGGLSANSAITTGAGGAGSPAYGVYFASGAMPQSTMAYNSISGVYGGNGSNGTSSGTGGAGGVGGAVFGFYATSANTNNNTFEHNSIDGVYGGYAGDAINVTAGVAGGAAAGIEILTVTNFSLINNTVYNVLAGQGGAGGQNGAGAGGAGGTGGIAYGIWTNPSTSCNVTNNSVANISAGSGGAAGNGSTNSGTGGAGAAAYGAYLQTFTNGTFMNNSIYNVTAGSGRMGGETGTGGTGGAGAAAYGVYLASGISPLPISDVNVSLISGGSGGNGTINTAGGAGGAAYGLFITGALSSNNSVANSSFSYVIAGGAGYGGPGTGAAGAAGGAASGIYLGIVNGTNITFCNITNVTAGMGGMGTQAYTSGLPGQASGIYFITVVDGQISSNNLTQIKGGTGGPSFGNGTATAGAISVGIHLNSARGLNIANNTIINLSSGPEGLNYTDGIPALRGTVIGIFINASSLTNNITSLAQNGDYYELDLPLANTLHGDPILYFTNISGLNLSGFESTTRNDNQTPMVIGEATWVSTALYLYNVTNSIFSNFNMTNLSGVNGASGGRNAAGAAGSITYAIYANNYSNNLTFSNFNISNIYGGAGGSAGYRTSATRLGGAGGTSAPIFMSTSVQNVSILNGSVSSIIGGQGGYGGGNAGVSNGGGAGGATYGLSWVSFSGSLCLLANSTVYNITGGTGGYGGVGGPGGAGGAVYALSYTTANESIINNVSVSIIKGGQGGNGTSAGSGGIAYGLYMATTNGSNISYLNVSHVDGGWDALMTTNATGYGIYLVNTCYANTFSFSHNEVRYLGSSQQFYSGQNQNSSSSSNKGWWPLINNLGASATTQANTAYFNGSQGGYTSALVAAPMNRFWYNNASAPISAVSIAFTNATSGHWFLANTTASDLDGPDDISSWNMSIASGSCVNLSTNDSGISRTIVQNCTGTPYASPIANVTVYDSVFQNSSIWAANTYPNLAPTAVADLLPNGGEAFSDAGTINISVNWTAASDADNDAIQYWLYYSNDSGSSYYFLTSTADLNYSWNASSLPSLESYRVRAYANDTWNVSSNTSSASDFTINSSGNPKIEAIAIAQSPAYDYSNLTCNVTVNDSKYGTLNVSYYWFKNGINQTSLAGSINVGINTNTLVSTLTYPNLTIGDNWSCYARANDSEELSAPNNTENVTILDGANLYFCKNLSTAGQTYSLAQNITTNATCFNISASNITLNGAGFEIRSNQSGIGVAISGVLNASVFNISVANFSTGIELASANQSLINHTNVSLSASYGIFSSSSIGNNYSNLNLSNNSGTGIRLDASSSSNNLSFGSFCFNGVDITSLGASNPGSSNTCDAFIGFADSGLGGGCSRSCSSFWHRFFGNISGAISLTDGSFTVMNWTPNSYNLYFADYDSNIHWDSLQAIGRNGSGSASSNDFTELDTKFGTSGKYDSIRNTYSSDGSAPLATTTIAAYGVSIANVPIANSSRASTNFTTGILWDKALSGVEYSVASSQPTVWIVSGNMTASSDAYGQYNYLNQIPGALAAYEGGTNLISMYVEFK